MDRMHGCHACYIHMMLQLKQRRWWASMFWGASSRDAGGGAVAAPAVRDHSRGAPALTGVSSLDLEDVTAAAADGQDSSAASLQGAASGMSASKTRKPTPVRRCVSQRPRPHAHTGAYAAQWPEHDLGD